MDDTVSRQAAIEIVDFECGGELIGTAKIITKRLSDLPPAQPDIQTHLCDSCKYSYPDCPSESNDVLFGNGKGKDNICACNKYLPSAQLEQQWIPCSERLPEDGERVLATHLCSRFNPDRQVTEHIYENGEFLLGWDMDLNMGEIIAWMPLPAPYQEGEQNE